MSLEVTTRQIIFNPITTLQANNMVKFSILLTPLLAVITSASFCLNEVTPEYRSLAAKFAAQDALDFPGQLNAAGTSLNIPIVARGGSTIPSLLKKLGWTVPNKKWINVLTYVHVVAASKKYEDGWVSNKAILEQLITLSRDYGQSITLHLTLDFAN